MIDYERDELAAPSIPCSIMLPFKKIARIRQLIHTRHYVLRLERINLNSCKQFESRRMSLSVYTVSDSDVSSEDSDDVNAYLRGVDFASSKKRKTEPKHSTSPSKPGPSSRKPKAPRKTDGAKQRLLEEKQKAKEEKRKAQEEFKRKLKEEKQKLAEEKQRQKEEKKKTNDLLKQIKPGECLKFVSVLIDTSLMSCKFSGELLTTLGNADVKYDVRDQRVRGTISWQKNFTDTNIDVPEHVLVVWLWEKLIDLISANNLTTTVKDLLKNYPGHKLTIIVFGIEEYFRRKQITDNRAHRARVLGEDSNQIDTSSINLGRDDVEMEMTSLQLMLGVQYHFLETKEEVGLFVSQFTKAVAELPFKLQRNKKQESIEWFAEADAKESVRVDADGNGLLRLWQQQICQFPLVGLDVAQAIVSQYGSPTCLMEAYDRCSTQREGELLLQDIQVRRGHGPYESSRRVGPELSKKMYKFYNSIDGNCMLSKNN